MKILQLFSHLIRISSLMMVKIKIYIGNLMRKIVFVLIAVIILFNINLNAQPEIKKVMNLNECIEIALQRNFDIQTNDMQIKSANADLTNAFGQYLPSFGFDMGYSKTFKDNIPNSTNYNMGLGANWTIFDGFAREANYARAQEQMNVVKLNNQFSVETVRLFVIQRYIDVIRKSQIVKIRKENLELGKKELERIQAMYEVGTIPISTLYSQEADLGNREFELVNSENDFNLSKSYLLTVMGLSPVLEVEFVETSIPSEVNDIDINNFRQQSGTIQSAIKKAVDNRADLKAVDANIISSKENVRYASSSYMPSLSANGGWSWANTEFTQFQDYGGSYIGLNLKVPLFTGFSTDLQVQNAKLRLMQTEIEKKKLEQEITQDIHNAYLKLAAAEKSLEISNKTIRSAEKNYESYKERFQVGSSNITDLTQANTLFITAQINRIRAVYDYLQAQKELLFAIGELK